MELSTNDSTTTPTPEPSLSQLQQLAGDLPELDFSASHADARWLASTAVQNYFNHYHINFSAEQLCQSHNFGQFSAAGFNIACHIWRPQKPLGTLFLIHGFTDSVGLMQHAIRFFLQQHWAVVAFDLPGHGLSSGTQTSIDSFDQYGQVLTECLHRCQGGLPQPWRGLGQSTGGAVWINFLSRSPPFKSTQPDVECVMLLAPLIRPKGWALARYFFPLYRRLVKVTPRKYGDNSHDPQFLDFVRHRDPLQSRITPMRWAAAMEKWIKNFQDLEVQSYPLTIVQGDDDQTVDFKYNIPAIVKKFPHTQVEILKGGRHQLVNESSEYRQQLFVTVAAWLRAQPGE